MVALYPSAPATHRQDGHQPDDEHHAEHRSFDTVISGDQIHTGGEERQGDDHPVQQSLGVEGSVAPIEIVDPLQLLLDHRPSLGVSFGVYLERIFVPPGVRPTIAHSLSLGCSSRGRSKLDAPGSSNAAGNSASGSACVQTPSDPAGERGSSTVVSGGSGPWLVSHISGSFASGGHNASASGDVHATSSSSVGGGVPLSTSPACSKADPILRAPE